MVTDSSAMNSHATEVKVKEIEQILVDPEGIDLWKLREACLSDGGLVHDSLRRRVWPLLVGLPSALPPHHPESPRRGVSDDEESRRSLHETDELTPLRNGTAASLDASFSVTEDMSLGDSVTTISRSGSRRSLVRYRRCQDHYQIDLDVARCTWHLLTGDQRAQRYQMEHKRNRQVARIIRRKQRRLGLFINLTLVQAEEERLRYYQGYHDVACIFLTTLASGPTPASQQTMVAAPPALELPARVLNQVSLSHFRDYLKDNFMDLQTALRLTVFPLLASMDPTVHDHLYAAEMEPFFCLSWIITWFAHEVRDSALVKRLFDAFLVGHPLLPLYVSIAMVLHPINRGIVLDTEPDFAILHQTLRGLPRNSSMVGWKYRPGDGYVSDDEEEEDDDEEEAAAEARLDAAVDGDIHQLRSVLDKDGTPNAPTGATSSVSTGSTAGANTSESHARVPFQELMDLALKYMQVVPPRQLLSVAKRYYGKAHVQALLAETSSIELLGDVPSWAIQPSLATGTSPKLVQRILRDKKGSKAVVALGFGLSNADRRRRRRRRFWFGVVAVALLAVAVAWADQQGMLQQMQNVLGWSSEESPGGSTCQSSGGTTNSTPQAPQGAPLPQEPMSVPLPAVGSTERQTVNTATPWSEAMVSGQEMVPEASAEPFVSVSPKTLVDVQAMPPPPARRPDVIPVASPQTTTAPGDDPSSPEVWTDIPAIKWMRHVSAQERFHKHVDRLSKLLGGHLGRLLSPFHKNAASRPMISDGGRARVARRLKPLRDFLNRPLDEMWREGRKIVVDQGKIMVGWLNNPACFAKNCASGKGRARH